MQMLGPVQAQLLQALQKLQQEQLCWHLRQRRRIWPVCLHCHLYRLWLALLLERHL
jgi:hypothetical protein